MEQFTKNISYDELIASATAKRLGLDNTPNEQEQEQPAQPQPVEGAISEQEQEQMLDAIQAQEDRTQEKLKEKQGIVIRGTKNW